MNTINLIADSGTEPLSGEQLRDALQDLFTPLLAKLRADKAPIVAVLLLGSGHERALVANVPPDLAITLMAEMVARTESGIGEVESGQWNMKPQQ